MSATALPTGALGAAALFWGVQAGLLIWAVPVALCLEAPRWISTRWAFEREDFNRISDLCAALFGIMAVFIYATRESPEAILTIFRLGPLTLLPLVLGQMFSERGRVDLSAFFLALRRQAVNEGIKFDVDLGYPFLASLLLGAAAGNMRGPGFYIGCAAIVGVALWSVRPARVRAIHWAALWLAASLLGAGVVGAIQVGRVYVYRKILDSYLARIGPRVDPSRAHTAIGRVGKLQQSNSVFLRVRPADKGGRVPPLLQDASYDVYKHEKWFARAANFKPVLASEPIGTWNVGSSRPEKAAIIVSKTMPKGTGLLSIPYGTHFIGGLPAESLERSRFGVLRVNGGPGFSEYRAAYHPQESTEGEPAASDLDLPKGLEAEGIRRVAREWGLNELAPRQSVSKMIARFGKDFDYSIYREEEAGEQPLVEFLTTRRRGHCEYFAAASVLLLRARGIPARYATGFAVRERDRYEEGFVVRGRHAHAWARAYVEGKWMTVDATPASWWPIENSRRSRFRSLMDVVDWIRYRWSAWRWRPVEEKDGVAWWVWVLAAIAGFVVWRNFRDWRPKTTKPLAAAESEIRKGLDSELFALEAARAEHGKGRRPGESLRRWCDRAAVDEPAHAALWRRVGRLHERHRFDPSGLADAEREELGAGAARLLREDRIS